MTLHNEAKSEEAFFDDRQWFAIQTYTLKEPIAKINFENQGFKVYMPKIKTLRRHARRVEWITRAFFPGY